MEFKKQSKNKRVITGALDINILALSSWMSSELMFPTHCKQLCASVSVSVCIRTCFQRKPPDCFHLLSFALYFTAATKSMNKFC